MMMMMDPVRSTAIGANRIIYGPRTTVIGPCVGWIRGIIVIVGWRRAVVARPWRGSEDTACHERRGGNHGSGAYDSAGDAKRKGEGIAASVVPIIPIGRLG
jgi:hypothetical protein